MGSIWSIRRMQMMSKQIVVIGGGAAGMMAAISAAEKGGRGHAAGAQRAAGEKVEYHRQGPVQRHQQHGYWRTLLANIPRNGKFLYSAFSRFSSADAMAFFEGLGVPLKTERGNRVFPVSDSAFDVSAALERRLRSPAGPDRCGTGRCPWTCRDGAVQGVAGERGSYPAEAVVLATGGVSLSRHRLHRRRPPPGSRGRTHRYASTGVPGAAAGHHCGGDPLRPAYRA